MDSIKKMKLNVRAPRETKKKTNPIQRPILFVNRLFRMQFISLEALLWVT
eukprot:m.358858 g.358858  ORF g.358858 m.358858 type:complete len:50 (-) comp16620_c0_seq2:415-564(-)